MFNVFPDGVLCGHCGEIQLTFNYLITRTAEDWVQTSVT